MSDDPLICLQELLEAQHASQGAGEPQRRQLQQPPGKLTSWEFKQIEMSARSPLSRSCLPLPETVSAALAAGRLLPREVATIEAELAQRPTRFVDVSQNPGRGAGALVVLPCMTPAGRVFDIQTGLFLNGRTKLHAQAIFPRQLPDPHNSQLEADLAGNAFNAVAFLAVISSAAAAVGAAG
jgi:hypothetical protein